MSDVTNVKSRRFNRDNINPRVLSRWAPVMVLVGEIIFFGSMRFDRFFTTANWHVILNNCALLGIISAGLTLVLIVGDFDLSIAGAIGLGGNCSCRISGS